MCLQFEKLGSQLKLPDSKRCPARQGYPIYVCTISQHADTNATLLTCQTPLTSMYQPKSSGGKSPLSPYVPMALCAYVVPTQTHGASNESVQRRQLHRGSTVDDFSKLLIYGVSIINGHPTITLGDKPNHCALVASRAATEYHSHKSKSSTDLSFILYCSNEIFLVK